MIVIFFFYGLAFFSLGLAVYFRTRSIFSPTISDLFFPLGLFGLLHGINEWAVMLDMLAPGQAFAPVLITLFGVTSFAALFKFGLDFAVPGNSWLGSSTRLSLLFLVVVLVTMAAEFTAAGRLYGVADFVSRYLMGVPGALMAGFALWLGRYTEVEGLSSNFYSRFAGGGLLLYGLLSMLTPTLPFFPASILNYDMFIEVFGFPVQLLRTVAAIIMATGMIGWLGQFSEQERVSLEKTVSKATKELQNYVSALRRAEASLIQSESRMKRAQNIAKVGHWDWQDGDAVVEFSDEALRLLGYDGIEPPALSFDAYVERIHPEDKAEFVSSLHEAASTATPFSVDHRLVADDGRTHFVEHHVEVTPKPDGGQGRRYSGVMRDVSDYKMAEGALRQAQKMEAVGQLAGGVAHDFNNLMAIIMGSAESLGDLTDSDPEAQTLIEEIQAAIDRGASLTGRLLTFSRQQSLAPVPSDLGQLVASLENMLNRTLGETVDVRVVSSGELATVMVDPHQFELALINLAINARDAMEGGGKLTIEVDNTLVDETFSEQIENLPPGAYVSVAVTDNGTGIPDSVLDRVFEPFFTTKEFGHGSGLGLSMVFGFVKQSQGHVSIYSELGAGTTVKLLFPSASGPTDEVRPAESEKEAVVADGHAVLVVEDDRRVRAIPVRALKDIGCVVYEAETGAEAIAILNTQPDIELLFTDIVLPGGMDGMEIAVAARTIKPDIKVLYTTGYAEGAIRRDEKLEEHATILNKPYRRADLIGVVTSMLKE